jgi:hypothetical protein
MLPRERDSLPAVAPSPPAHNANASLSLGLLFFVLALAFYYFSVLRIDYYKTAHLDLGPYPDAVEYLAQAKSILTKGRPQIQIGYDTLPSRYGPGYPALMLPSLELLPKTKAVLAPFRTNQTIGFLLLLATFATYARLARPIAGGIAALLLSTLPGFFTYCRSSMSEISAAALAVTVFILIYFGLAEKRRWQIYLGAFLLGLSLNIRTQLVFFAPLLIAMAVFPGDRSRVRWFLHCGGVLVVFAVAASPAFIINALQFGSPLRTGYEFWVPSLYESGHAFSLHNVSKHAEMLWADCALRARDFGVANLFGTGAYFTPAFVILICAGIFFLRPSRYLFAAGLAGLTFFTATAMYTFVDGRFYLPVLMLLIAVAVLPVEWAFCRLLARKDVGVALPSIVIFGAACAGYPSQTGYPPERGHWQARDALRIESTYGPSPAFAAQTEFAERFGQRPGIVLSDIDPVYLNALLPRGFVAAPIDGAHNYPYSKLWRYDKDEARSLVTKGLSEHVVIYAIFFSKTQMATNLPRLPQIDGHQWVPLDEGDRMAVATLL